MIPLKALAPILIAASLGVLPDLVAQNGDDWPQWRGPTRDGVWRENGTLAVLPDVLEPKWRVPIGTGYCGPTVADGRVYVMDRLVDPEQVERVLCFSWDTGELLWKHEYESAYIGVQYEAGPRCSVQIDDGLAWSLGTMGHLFCFNAETGDVVWSRNLGEDYRIDMPIWGISAAPLLEADLLIVPVSGTDGAYLVAFDKRSGEERWKALSDRGNYSAPIAIDQAGERVVVVRTADRVVGVASNTGSLLWQHPFESKNMPLTVATPVRYQNTLFFTGFYDGCLLLRIDPDQPSVSEVWRRRGRNERSTDGLHSTISTPLIRDGYIYGVDSYGELRCLDIKDGSRVWEDLGAVPRSRWATIHFVQNGERTWMFNERGELLIAELSPEGFREIDRAALIKPTREQLNQRGGVAWSHPAFAYRHVFARNDEELVCVDLTAR